MSSDACLVGKVRQLDLVTISSNLGEPTFSAFLFCFVFFGCVVFFFVSNFFEGRAGGGSLREPKEQQRD